MHQRAGVVAILLDLPLPELLDAQVCRERLGEAEGLGHLLDVVDTAAVTDRTVVGQVAEFRRQHFAVDDSDNIAFSRAYYVGLADTDGDRRAPAPRHFDVPTDLAGGRVQTPEVVDVQDQQIPD